ncbi:uncharacterized protein LOC108301798 isoform X6 [Cebus imitator]|uniref:uncharacterized protein LOC108301798 isoform X6 n=1 Tax=Cebus imitator TaxID=2715852 RepID=UPI0018997EE4|nr:uncharacterized protein LOC108301798 isoform X6 [Cebus imitator]
MYSAPRAGALAMGAYSLLARKIVDFLSSEGRTESWIWCDLASTVHLVLADSSIRSSCCGRPSACWHGRWSIVPSNEGPTESWFWCGLASMVHPMLVDNSIWSSCCDRSIACWQGRWSILLTNRGCFESLIWHGLTSAVHPVLAGGSRRGSCCGRHSTCWKKDGEFHQATKATWSPCFGVAQHPQCTWCWWVAQDGGVGIKGRLVS